MLTESVASAQAITRVGAHGRSRRLASVWIVLALLSALVLSFCSVGNAADARAEGKGAIARTLAGSKGPSTRDDDTLYASGIPVNVYGERDVELSSDAKFPWVLVYIEPEETGYQVAVFYELGDPETIAYDVRREWVEKAAPTDAKIAFYVGSDDVSETAVVSLHLEDSQALAWALSSLFQDDGSQVDSRLTPDDSAPLKFKNELQISLDCSAVCEGQEDFVLVASPGGSREFNEFLKGELDFSEDAKFDHMNHADGLYTYTNDIRLDVEKLHSKLIMGSGDSIQFEVSLTIPTFEHGVQVEDAEAALKAKGAEVSSVAQDDGQVMTMRWESEGATDLVDQIRNTFPSFRLTHARGDGLWPSDDLLMRFDPAFDLNATFAQEPRLEVRLPFLARVEGTSMPEGGFLLSSDGVHVKYSVPSGDLYLLVASILGVLLNLLLVFALVLKVRSRSKSEGRRSEQKKNRNESSMPPIPLPPVPLPPSSENTVDATPLPAPPAPPEK